MSRVDFASRAGALCFFAGIFTCTWDLLLTFDIGGFTFKIHQLLFLLSLGFALFSQIGCGLAPLLKPLKQGFPVCILLLAAYYFSRSPWSEFPLKSALYSGWLCFNLFTIWYSCQIQKDSFFHEKLLQVVWWALIFLSIVVSIDQIAFQFGYNGGLIGNNQDTILNWGVSRPHAFSSEPSYLAVFMGLAILLIYPYRLPHGRPLILGLLALSFYALLATTSRTGWVSMGLGFALIFGLEFFSTKTFPWRRVGLAALCAGLAFGVFYFGTPSNQRKVLDSALVTAVYKGTDGSGNSRIRAHKIAFQIAQETNWLGAGMGASYKYWASRGHDVDMVGADTYSFHPGSYGKEVIMSIWGQILAEGGLPALGIYFMAMFFLLRSLWQSWWKSRRSENLNALASAATFVFFIAFFLGNVARGDIWVWFAVWSFVSHSLQEKTDGHFEPALNFTPKV